MKEKVKNHDSSVRPKHAQKAANEYLIEKERNDQLPKHPISTKGKNIIIYPYRNLWTTEEDEYLYYCDCWTNQPFILASEIDEHQFISPQICNGYVLESHGRSIQEMSSAHFYCYTDPIKKGSKLDKINEKFSIFFKFIDDNKWKIIVAFGVLAIVFWPIFYELIYWIIALFVIGSFLAFGNNAFSSIFGK